MNMPPSGTLPMHTLEQHSRSALHPAPSGKQASPEEVELLVLDALDEDELVLAAPLELLELDALLALDALDALLALDEDELAPPQVLRTQSPLLLDEELDASGGSPPSMLSGAS